MCEQHSQEHLGVHISLYLRGYVQDSSMGIQDRSTAQNRSQPLSLAQPPPPRAFLWFVTREWRNQINYTEYASNYS